MKHLILSTLAISMVFAATAASAEDYVVSLKGDVFSPKEITIPADQKVKIIVKNLNPAPMEFESHKLNREKVIAGNSEATVIVGPLTAGSYSFVDEFQEETAKGSILVK